MIQTIYILQFNSYSFLQGYYLVKAIVRDATLFVSLGTQRTTLQSIESFVKNIDKNVRQNWPPQANSS